MTSPRLAILASHPIQYHAPLYRSVLAQIDGRVYYGSIPDSTTQGAGFGVPFQWDLPLLEGYNHTVFAQELSSRFDPIVAARAFQALLRDLFAFRPDAILCTGWYHPSLWIGLAAARLTGAKCLLRCESNLLRPRSTGASVFQKFVLSQFSAFLSIGEMNKRFYSHFGIPDSRIFSAPYFIDNARFARASASANRQSLRTRWGIPQEAFCFVFSGKLEEKKHPASVIQAMTGLAGAHLLIVGAGPLEQSLRHLAAECRAGVSFTGFLNQSEIPLAYAASDCLVLPSDAGETWGLVVNEAMACGLPAIVSDRVGCRLDLIKEEVTGKSFPFGNVPALASAMKFFLESPERTIAAGRRARDHIAAYSVEAATSGTVKAVLNNKLFN